MTDKTALSYWFPKLEAAGIPVPKTKILAMPKRAQEDIWAWFDGKEGGGGLKPFIEELSAAASAVGFPCFLRTDHTSGKHEWDRTCFVPTAAELAQHVFNIAEHSEICDFLGLPWETWIVREFLPTIPLGVCPHYGNMPICREFRFFVDDGAVRCWHPYWPRHALEDGGAEMSSLGYDQLCRMPFLRDLSDLAEAAGRAVGESWSIDILETRRGWFVTDMAEARKSFHWEGCPHSKN